MVDLVKIRKKAKKKAEVAEQAASASAETHESPAPPPPAPQLQAFAPEPSADEASAPLPAATSKLARFREQAGRLRNATDASVTSGESAPSADQLEVLSFVIAGEHFAADIERIVEIVTPRAITRVPNTSSSIRGIVSLRGTMVTIVDIRSRLRQAAGAASADTRIIVVDQHGETIGFEVDEVLRVLKIDRTAVEPHPVVHASEIDDSILGVFRHEGALTILLDFDKLLAEVAVAS